MSDNLSILKSTHDLKTAHNLEAKWVYFNNLRHPGPNSQKYSLFFLLWPIYVKLFINCFPICTYIYICLQGDEVCLALWYSWMRRNICYILEFNSKHYYQMLPPPPGPPKTVHLLRLLGLPYFFMIPISMAP